MTASPEEDNRAVAKWCCLVLCQFFITTSLSLRQNFSVLVITGDTPIFQHPNRLFFHLRVRVRTTPRQLNDSKCLLTCFPATTTGVGEELLCDQTSLKDRKHLSKIKSRSRVVTASAGS